MIKTCAKKFSTPLLAWYAKHQRDLPWRRTTDPYKIWISEIMLQQTTVNVVIPYYKRWASAFPTVHSVSKAPLQKVLRLWQGLGYYARAKNIHKCAKMIRAKHGGKIPSSFEGLKGLPGFGPYTTGAVLSIAFGKRVTIIDANVRRVVMRYLGKKGFADAAHDPAIKKFLEKVFPPRDASSFNQALMELGALVCRSRRPLCLACPLRTSCRAYQEGLQDIIPTPKKISLRNVYAVIALIEKDGKYFIQKRPSQGLFADLWEFPGGKIEKGEGEAEALRREIKEELNVDVVSLRHAMRTHHFYTQFRANLSVYECEVVPDPKVGIRHRWVNKADLCKFPMPSGSAKIVEGFFK